MSRNDERMNMLWPNNVKITRGQVEWTEKGRVDFIAKIVFLKPDTQVKLGDVVVEAGRRLQIIRVDPVKDPVGKIQHTEVKWKE